MKTQTIILILVVVAIIGAIAYLQSTKVSGPAGGNGPAVTTTDTSMTKDQKTQQYPAAKELVNPSGFVNSEPFTIQSLIGKKVILVDFWTFSCINCQRTLPYLTSWYDKYKDQGLEIVGIHTPEFEFEKDINNVKLATQQYGIKYPVVLDNDYGTWGAYGNRYWPREYLIDRQGQIVHDHIGEGGYDETEMKIKELLGLNDTNLAKPIVEAPSAGTSAETYFGSNRNNNFNTGLKLIGDWDIQPEFAAAKTVGAKIDFAYRAKNVYFVASADAPVEIEVKQDGQTIKTLTVKDAKLYTLIQNAGVESHQLEIIIKSPTLRAYTFTFG